MTPICKGVACFKIQNKNRLHIWSFDKQQQQLMPHVVCAMCQHLSDNAYAYCLLTYLLKAKKAKETTTTTKTEEEEEEIN